MLMLFLDMIDDPADRRLFERLYYHYRNYMYATSANMLNDGHLAEDAVSEAFMRIAKNFSRFRENLSLEEKDPVACPRTAGFITVVVKNVCLNMLSRNDRDKIVLVDDVEHIIASDHVQAVEMQAADMSNFCVEQGFLK